MKILDHYPSLRPLRPNENATIAYIGRKGFKVGSARISNMLYCFLDRELGSKDSYRSDTTDIRWSEAISVWKTTGVAFYCPQRHTGDD